MLAVFKFTNDKSTSQEEGGGYIAPRVNNDCRGMSFFNIKG